MSVETENEAVIRRLANGKLVETHNAANLLEVFQQIGSLPPRG